MQNIWNKAYSYQLNQPKVPHPKDDQCWLVDLGQKQHCCWGNGSSDFVSIYFALDCRVEFFPLRAIKLCLKPVRTSP